MPLMRVTADVENCNFLKAEFKISWIPPRHLPLADVGAYRKLSRFKACARTKQLTDELKLKKKYLPESKYRMVRHDFNIDQLISTADGGFFSPPLTLKIYFSDVRFFENLFLVKVMLKCLICYSCWENYNWNRCESK